MGNAFFSPGDSHTKRLLEVDTDPKGRFVPFNITPLNDRVLCVYAPSGYSTRKPLPRGHFFEELQNYMENKNERNKKNNTWRL